MREILTFVIFAVLLGLLFFLYPGGNDWRANERNYRQVGAVRNLHGGLATAAQDSAGLELRLDSFSALLRDGGLADRIAVLQDSLQSIYQELDGYRDLLAEARDRIRVGLPAGKPELTGKYFSSVSTLRQLERDAEIIGADLDTLLTGIASASDAGPNSPKGPALLRWLSPSRVPVHEACTSCHLLEADGSRVMLLPQEKPDQYPVVMLQHPPAEFGCTVCHFGSAGDLSLLAAHGPDRLGRPFRPGRLALRSCGICHALLSPLQTAAVPFSWPESCARCHAGETLSALVDSSAIPALRHPLNPVSFRGWLLRHWGEKEGVLPDREEFENTVSLLSSGERKAPSADSTEENAAEQAGQPREGELTVVCPLCGRKYKIAAGVEFTCPADGTPLEKEK